MHTKIERNYNILCIDDNQNNLFTLSALLENAGNINSIEALGAKEGLNKLLQEDIDLILLDIQMPEMDGFEVARLIKSNKKTKDIPIIFLTAVFKSEEFIQEGFEIGAVDYLTKPIDDNQLLNKIALYLKIFEQHYKMQQSEKKFMDIAQNIGDGIFTLDLNYKTTFINDAALKMLGFEANELLGKKIHKYIHYKDTSNKPINPNECHIYDVMRDAKVYRNENEYFIKKDGSFLPVIMTTSPLFDEERISGSVTIFKDKSEQEKIISLENEKMKNQEQIIHSMIEMIESRDSYTAGHTKRVAKYCELIAREMKYSEDEINILKKAAWLHDIGKISTPDSILLKPSKLTNVEYELIKEHLSSGYEMLRKIDQYKEIADIMREHHEKYDGSGYPQGLKGEAIMPLSRIMIVADAFDAMTTNRVYKPRKSVQDALSELKELSAKHFHPEVVSSALEALKDVDIDSGISQLPKSSMEEQRFSYFYRDRLTGLYIIEYLPLLLRYHIQNESNYFYDIKLKNFTEYNKKYGWSQGDRFLQEFASFLKSLYTDTIIFRVEGDDFMIVSSYKIKEIHNDIQEYSPIKNRLVDFSIKEKFIEYIEDDDTNILSLLSR